MGSFSYLKIAAIGSGFFALSLVWMTYNAFMPLILSEHIASKALRGGIMGLDNLAAVLLIPFIGSWSDRLDTRYGKRLPFIAVGMPAAAILLTCLVPASRNLWSLMALDVFFLIAMTIYRAPVIALMPDSTPFEKRAKANGVINFMGGLGTLTALMLIGRLWDLNHNYPFLLSSAFMLASFVFLWFQVDRSPSFNDASTNENDEAMLAKSLRQGLKLLFTKPYRKQLYVLIGIFFFFFGFSGIEAQFTTYATESLGLTGGQASMTLGFFVLALVAFSIPAGMLGSKFGKLSMMTMGSLVLAIVFFAAPFFHSMLALRCLFVLGGMGWAMILIQAYPTVADMGGKSDVGLMTGFYYFFSMSSAIIGPPLLGLVIDKLGYPAMFFTAASSELVALAFMYRARVTLSTGA